MSRIHGSPGDIRCLALLLCERVITDRDTADDTLVGILREAAPNKYPCTPPNWVIYVELSGTGKVDPIFLGIKAPDPEETFLLTAELGVHKWNDFGTCYIVVPLAGLMFPKPGDYVVRLFNRDRILAERVFRLRPAFESPKEREH